MVRPAISWCGWICRFVWSLPSPHAKDSADGMGAEQVSFEVADALTAEFSAASYDVVYSRDTVLHVKNKAALFKR